MQRVIEINKMKSNFEYNTILLDTLETDSLRSSFWGKILVLDVIGKMLKSNKR